jgi:hypothetical protein
VLAAQQELAASTDVMLLGHIYRFLLLRHKNPLIAVV